MRDESFHLFVVQDLFGDIDGVTSKPLFSGWGIYKDGVIFALALNGELYFKVNESNLRYFKDMGSHPFSYQTKVGEKTLSSYWLLPEEILENKDDINEWVDRSVAASFQNIKE